MKPIIIIISGGSASGKTTVVNELIERLHSIEVTVIKHDDYYKDNKEMTFEERKQVNYDHPDSLDNDLLINNLKDLIAGKEIQKPLYDFVTHRRKEETEIVKPTRVIIVEGILTLVDPKLKELADIKIFVKCDEDLRFIRRLERDINERGRTLDDVIKQYLATVKPMFNTYIRPSSREADLIVPNDNKHDIAVDFLAARIKEILQNKE